MKWWILVCVLLETALIPVFLRYCWPTKTKKSLLLKMLCSLMFVVIGILALKSREETGVYARPVLLGLCAGWIGDFMLHVYPHRAFQATGVLFFFTGHVLYILAFHRAIVAQFPGTHFLGRLEWIALALMALGYLTLLLVSNIRLGSAAVAIFPYAGVIVLMIVKAWSLGVRMLYSAAPGALPIQLLLSVGTVLFLFSDSLLALIEFHNRKGFRIKAVNIATYYAAQVALACSIAFVPV